MLLTRRSVCVLAWRFAFAVVAHQVVCIYGGNVRLIGGSNKTGIVEIYSEDQWKLLCGWPKIGTTEARIICQELGFELGSILPLAAYGPLSGNYSDPLMGCGVSDVSILDCAFDKDYTPNVCKTQTIYYTSVNCYNGTYVSESSIKIEEISSSDNSSRGKFGAVAVSQGGISGQVCSSYWSDVDANVSCRQLGFSGGVALVYDADMSVPYLLTGVHCNGNESRLDDCYSESQICYNKQRAGVLCYETEGLHVRLSGDDPKYGTVVIDIDGQSGTICNQNWSTEDAIVVCRQLGYVTGIAVSNQSPTNVSGEFLLSDLGCNGAETSLLQCPSSGWKNINDSVCQNYMNNAMVRCFDSVRLSSGYFTSNVSMGIVEVYQKHFWTTLCTDKFDNRDAAVVCRQLNFDEGKVLVSGTFGSPYLYTFTTSIECQGNETDILDCPHKRGSCPYSSYASVLCLKKHVNKDYTISLDTDVGGRVYVKQYGIKGTICRSGWDDVDASVVCKQFGFKGGQSFGTLKQTSRYRPIWLTDVKCKSTDTSLYNCDVGYNITIDCGRDMSDAGVICYNTTGMQVRLSDGTGNNTGRVEVSRDSVWGTICDSKWSGNDGKVVCRQLGYADASIYHGSYHGPGSGPIYMDGLDCDGREKSVFQCPNYGWNVSAYQCANHKRDAGVYCFRWVQVSITYYGAVQVWKEGIRYGKVCADGFDANAAKVVCRELGYKVSVNLCCSAFGPMTVPFTMSDVKCTGLETSLRDCQHTYNQPSCPSNEYASVYCLNEQLPPPTSVYAKIWNIDRGLVKVNYAYKDGLVCSENFTDLDARVVCKERKFADGIALRHYTPPSAYGIYVRWLNGMSCTGTEMAISQCPGLDIGELGHCNSSVSAGVICTTTAGSTGLQIRLQGGAKQSEGRVELSVDGTTWYALCAGNLTNSEASVICRQGGWRDGVALKVDSFGNDTINPLLDFLECNGNEDKIVDCVSRVSKSNTFCSAISTVKCYETVRITGSSVPEFGRVELWQDNKWVAVCDAGFDDEDARVVCRYLGYSKGLAHCCSAAGKLHNNTTIAVTNYDCSGNHFDPTSCSYQMGVCSSGHYASVLCLSTAVGEGTTVELPPGSSYGPISVTRYGLGGFICDLEYEDVDARAICKTLGYQSGYAVRTYTETIAPMIMGKLQCPDTAADISSCSYSEFGKDNGCYMSKTVAGAICTKSKLELKIREIGVGSGTPYLYVDKVNMYIDGSQFDNKTAGVFCRSIGYAGGTTGRGYKTTASIIGVHCNGSESSFLECKGYWDPSKKTDMISAYVNCHEDVRLVGGGTFYGAVEVYKNGVWGTVCPQTFDARTADVVCKTLKFEKGMPVCCSQFGSLPSPQLLTNVSCNGDEHSVLDCKHTYTGNKVPCKNPWDYASVFCYNGAKKQAFSISLRGKTFFSEVLVTYMGVEGRICQDNWDDRDAKVVCRELNFVTGLAYNHYVESGDSASGPYWTSDVNCSGQERSLKDCNFKEFGSVKECKSRHFAGVLCYDSQGLYYRISGGDSSGKSGRVEIYFNKVWGTVCDTYWDRPDAQVLCRQMGYKDGDPYIGTYRVPATSGPIFETNYECTGKEDSLNQCPHSGWYETTAARCTKNQNDAGVFCYENVKIYNSVGRDKDSGPVLIYRDNKWYALCDDGFNNHAARLVCQELGFFDGAAKCCSAEGQIGVRLWQNNTIKCQGGETSVFQCLKRGTCASGQYASVRCSYTALPTFASTTLPSTVSVQDRFVVQNNYVIPVVVSVIVVAVAVVIITVCVLKYRRSAVSRSPSGKYHPRVLQRSNDGSFSVENPLHNVNESYSEVSFQPGNVAQYSPGAENLDPRGYNNFVYNSMKNAQSDNSLDCRDTKPLAEDSTFTEDSPNYTYITPNFSISESHPYDSIKNVKESGESRDELDDNSKTLVEREEIPSPVQSIVKK